MPVVMSWKSPPAARCPSPGGWDYTSSSSLRISRIRLMKRSRLWNMPVPRPMFKCIWWGRKRKWSKYLWRTRDPSQCRPRCRSRTRRRQAKHTPRVRPRNGRIRSRDNHERGRRTRITPRTGLRDPRKGLRDSCSFPRYEKSPFCVSEVTYAFPDAEVTPRNPTQQNRRIYTRDGTRQEQERTGGIQWANHGIGRASAPTREDAGRAGTLCGQHIPVHPLGGPWDEPPSLISPHEAGRYGHMSVEAPKTIDQLYQLITGGV